MFNLFTKKLKEEIKEKDAYIENNLKTIKSKEDQLIISAEIIKEKNNEIIELRHKVKFQENENLKLKLKFADILQIIRNINENSSYDDVKKRRISEICTDNCYKLLIDTIERTRYGSH